MTAKLSSTPSILNHPPYGGLVCLKRCETHVHHADQQSSRRARLCSKPKAPELAAYLSRKGEDRPVLTRNPVAICRSSQFRLRAGDAASAR